MRANQKIIGRYLAVSSLDTQTRAGIALRIKVDNQTRSPMAASAVARLIAVVVLPTPPFDSAIVIIRFRSPIIAAYPIMVKFDVEGDLTPETTESRSTTLLCFYQIEFPTTTGFLDLALVIPAFAQQQTYIFIALHPRRRVVEQHIQLREGSCQITSQ